MHRLRFAIVMLIAMPALVAGAWRVSGPVSADDGTQATTGSIQGQVTDSTNAAISGAKVTLSNTATSYKATTQSDDTGTFKVFNIPFNEYKVRVEGDGF